MRRKCRIWWPTHLSLKPPESTFLFGWFVQSSSNLLDIVVAFGCSHPSINSVQSRLQEILHQTNGNMTMVLQDECTFSMLGCCQADSKGDDNLASSVKTDNDTDSINGIVHSKKGKKRSKKRYDSQSCRFNKMSDLLELSRRASIGKTNWIQLVYDYSEYIGRRTYWIPKLQQIKWNGLLMPDPHLHIIIYETPKYGGHCFSLGSYSSSEQVKSTIKKPLWVKDLCEKQIPSDLDTVILSINCAAAAKLLFEELAFPGLSIIRLCSVHRFLTFMWRLFAISVASFSSAIYIFLQIFRVLLSYGSQSCIYIMSAKLFSCTFRNIQFHCCQILYWPIFLQNSAHRSVSCVEYAEKAALRKHLMWSSVVVDVLFGNILGVVLLVHAKSVGTWTSKIFSDITNHVLRLGCVSLMGNPAGFKLNNELAGVLGILSLNAVQIWCTIWFFLSSFSLYFIRGVAVSGILFGLTTAASLVIDFISLATMHVRCLHWIISLIFSHQLQAVAALWRLFRGQKLNPLRRRLDSYDYTVDQHVVGSLLFTPVLLLLPTSSAFYIFFALLGTTVSVVCIFIQFAISVIHATPYTKVFLWMLMPRRFPFGLWVEVVSCQSDAVDNLETGAVDKVVLFLHGSSLNIRQVVFPHYRFLCSAFSRLSFATSMYGILIGRSLPSTLNNFSSASVTGLPMTLPWMSIPYKEYWWLCYESVFACKTDYKCNLH